MKIPAILLLCLLIACSKNSPAPVAPSGKTACPMCEMFETFEAMEDSTEAEGSTQDVTTDLPDSLSFNIELVYLNDDLTDEDIAIVEEMASLWEQVIIGDLPDYELEHELFWDFEQDGRVIAKKGEIIDDIRIYVATLDPAESAYGGTLWERWDGELFQSDPGLPAIGAIWIKSLTTLREIGYPHVEQETRRVVAHEMGHALGIGTTPRWDALVKQKDGQYYFDGPQAIEAWNAAGGASYEGNKVPFADAGSHWDNLLFNDIMVNGAFDIRISSVTVAALADIGYEVGPSPTLDVRVRPFEEKLAEWGEKADERHNWIACFHHGDCPSSEDAITPSPNLVNWEDWESASAFLLTCPTPDEVAEIDRDINITFANDPTADWPLACTAVEGSVDLSPLQMGAYQSLRFMKAVEFEEPIPWETSSLYDWFIALPDTLRFDGKEEYSYATDQRKIVISGFIEIDESGEFNLAPTWIWNYRYDKSSMGQAAVSWIQLFVHEARHIEGPGHTCDGGNDKTFSEMGSWAYAYYTLAWFTHKSVSKSLFSHKELLGLRWQINDLCSTRICEEGCPPIKSGLRGGGPIDDT